MRKYKITGMSCAACSARVEKAVSSVEGVTSCSVNLLTNSMIAQGTFSDEEIINAVKDAGYGISLQGAQPDKKEDTDTELSGIIARLWVSFIFLALLMYLSMGHSMWGWPVPEFVNPVNNGILQMLLSGIVIVVNQRFFISGFKAVSNKSANMDTLVAIGSGASFVYSVYVLLSLGISSFSGDIHSAHRHMHGFYFESAAMIVTLISVGKLLETRSKGKTTDAISSLKELSPKTATLICDGKEITVPVEDIQKGDVFAVKPGERIPADGIVLKGSSAVNESALTGESIPSDKAPGDKVCAATVNMSGYLVCEAVDVGEDTVLSKIIQMVSDASADKAPVAKIADKVSGVFVPIVICISVITFLIWFFSGNSFGYALARGISVLVISCPCALGLATPVAIMVGNGVGAKNGILFKTAVSLEQTGKVNTVVLDKTGTVTKGEPVVTDIISSDGFDNTSLIEYALSLEAKSEHPLARAIVRFAEQNNIVPVQTDEFSVSSGNGLGARIGEIWVYGGNEKYISSFCTLPSVILKEGKKLSFQGKTPLYFCADGRFAGIIAVSDSVKEDSAEAVARLKQMGVQVVMLTGDNENTANAIADQVGIDKVVAQVLPDEKAEKIAELMEYGKVAMVGDGINDAPALTRADTGIAIGAGTDIAIDSADVVLMKSSLMDVANAIELSRVTLRNIHQNLFWAFFYNILGIPVAAGILIPFFGIELSPMIGAAAMSLSSFCVVTNALRLNRVRLGKKGRKNMTFTIKIEGMMCPHCEARVKSIIEGVQGVSQAVVSYKEGTAVVTADKDIFGQLKELIEADGYKVS